MRLAALMVVLIVTPLLPADILHLRDGSRYYGELISQNSREVVFRVTLDDGASGIVQTFAQSLVERVERTIERQAPTRRRTEESGQETAAEDYAQMLREGFELLDDGDSPSALRAIQRAVLRAPTAQLKALEELCQTARGVPLDVLLAGTRLRLASAANRGRALKLKYATPYERIALARLLIQEQDGLLARRYAGRTVAEWTAHRDDYTALAADARELVADASRAAAIIAIRLRFDHQLAADRRTRVRSIELRADLARLAAHILALPGYTAPPEGEEPSDLPALGIDLPAAGAAAATQPVENMKRDTSATDPVRPGGRRAPTPPAKGNQPP